MAYYRTVNIDFWQDVKVVDNFTPEDKYFMLYLLTNPKTNLIGCYELSFRTASAETGYNKETIERLIRRFMDVHEVIDYDQETKEILIFNWHKYNWTKSTDLKKGVLKGLEKVKTKRFRDFIESVIHEQETVYRPSIDRRGTSVTVTVTDTVTDTGSVKRIVEYLNSKVGSNYKHTSDKTKRLIEARLKEGFTEDDFKKVIDIKVAEWKKDEKMSGFLRPITLFGTKFESYLNQPQKQVDEFRPGEIIDLPFLDEGEEHEWE